MRAALLAIACGLGSVAAAVIVALPGGTAARTGGQAVPVVDRGSLPTRAAATQPVIGTSPAPTAGLPAGSRLLVPRLGVDAPLVHVKARSNVMQVPLDPHTLGWWSGGAAPGASAGSAVVVGHINYAGTSGALAVLPDARPGDVVTVEEKGRSVGYRVVAVRTYPKTTGIPGEAFRTGGPPQLVLITCGGPFDPASGNYEDNIVVYAVPS